MEYLLDDYQNYYEIWNRLKLPYNYQKYTKRFGTTLKNSAAKIIFNVPMANCIR